MSESYPTRELTESDVERIDAVPKREAILARPDRSNGGIEAMDDVLESLYDPQVETSGGLFGGKTENMAPGNAFEMRYATEPTGSNRVLSLQYVPGEESFGPVLERRLTNQYPNSRLERRETDFLSVNEGEYISGATLNLRYYTLLPVKNISLGGEWRSDPTGAIMTEMVGEQETSDSDADVAVQIMFRPAPRDWLQGVERGDGVASDVTGQSAEFDIDGSPSVRDLAYDLRQKTVERNALLPFPLSIWYYEEIEHAPSKKAKDVARMLEEQEGKAWELCARIFAVSDDGDVAADRAASTAMMFQNFFEYRSEQSFIPEPFNSGDLVDELTAAARREMEDTGIIQPQTAAAGVVNIPEAEHVTTNKMRWSLAKPGEGVPPGTPRFDREAYGLTADASDAETQVAMIDAAGEAGEGAYWYGFGSTHGVEVGSFPIHLDAHQFVNGATRKGKTTWLTNFASQVYRRDEGALIVDPKGKDADEFIAEWPADRDEEDLIVYDLSDEDDRVPRFNFLEIPDGLEPGSRAHASYVEALADDLTSMVAEAGGQDNYLGALMKRVTKTLVRGLAKSGRTCTLLDLACAGSSAENLGTFREWMDDERVEFIRETAARLEEKEDTDLEPLAGRFDEWIHNDAVRDLIAAREPSFSVQEAVEEGKVIVVRFPKGAGDTEKRLLTTALIRRTYCSQRQADTQRPFHLICDEFDSVVSGTSSIPSVLSEAGAFKYRCTLACQNPSNQLPETVKYAVENQCETWVSFNPGGGRAGGFVAQQHSERIGKQELTDLPKYSFYFRTHDRDDNPTTSFMVDSFPPVREVRADVEGVAPREDEEIMALKRRSLERYGEVPESPAEQQADSPFLGGDVSLEDEPGEDQDDDRQCALCKAVYDAALRTAGDGLAWVGADAVRDRLERYTEREWAVAQFAALADQTPEIEYRDTDTDEELRCSEAGRERFLPAGDNQTEGGLSHRGLLRDAYDPLVRLGLEVELPEQGGGAETDGIGRIRETFDPDVDPWADPDAFTDALSAFQDEHPALAELTDAQDVTIEAESSTSGKPAATCANLAKAVAEDKRCLFLARPEKAQQVFKTLSAPPYLNASPGDADRRFYNRKRLQVDGERPLRPAGAERTVWREVDGEIVLEDNEGREHARFESVDAVFSDLDAYPAHTGLQDVDEADIGRGAEWRPVAKPWIPEREFNGPVPGPKSWRLVVVERDGTLRRFETGAVISAGERTDASTDTDEGASADSDGSDAGGADGSAAADAGEGDAGDDDDDPWDDIMRMAEGE